MWVTEYHLEPDSFKPHKRPLSMASPSIILDEAGDVKMVFGAAGGKYIATTLAQVNEYPCVSLLQVNKQIKYAPR